MTTTRRAVASDVLLFGALYALEQCGLAHNPKIQWDMSEQDALDILTMTSLIHRKLKASRR